MKRIAVISAILDDPHTGQPFFNETVSNFKHLVKGRMGLPFEDADIAVIAIVVEGSIDEINAFTGQLGRIEQIHLKTAFSSKSSIKSSK